MIWFVSTDKNLDLHIKREKVQLLAEAEPNCSKNGSNNLKGLDKYSIQDNRNSKDLLDSSMCGVTQKTMK